MPADQKKCHAKRLPNENWGFLVHNWDGLPLLSADCQAISAFKMDYVWHTTLTWMGNFFPQRQGSSIRWQERIINSYSPTDPFTILMPHKPSIGVSELHKIPRSTDLETLKLGKGPVTFQGNYDIIVCPTLCWSSGLPDEAFPNLEL